MKRKRLILDVDGVVADFTGELLRTVGSSLTVEDVKVWQVFDLLTEGQVEVGEEALATPEWWQNQPVLPGALLAVEHLASQYEIFWTTSPWWSCVGWETARRNWLRNHFDADPRHVVITSYKGIIGGDAIVDDKPSNVETWLTYNPDKPGILFGAPYNRRGYNSFAVERLEGWPAILDRLLYPQL